MCEKLNKLINFIGRAEYESCPINKYKKEDAAGCQMLSLKKYKDFAGHSRFALGGDIGGTNTSLGIFGIKGKKAEILVSFHFRSDELNGLHYAVNEALEYARKKYHLKVSKACFAVAGCLSPDRRTAKATNVKWDVKIKDLLKKTKLKKISIINDFEAIGYGLSMLSKKDIKVIKKAKKTGKAPILIIGAGTGLGKATLIYDIHSKSYAPMPSEAGHADFAAQTQMEMDLAVFIKKYKQIRQTVSYEQVLSGQGLINIYMFLRKSGKFKETSFTMEIDASLKPELISKYRKIDKTCRRAFEIFRLIYAKFARNLALDCLAWGGVYIAGGIAPKNMEIFDREFIKIFSQSHKMSYALGKVPIYLVLNCNAGLLGAGLRSEFLQ